MSSFAFFLMVLYISAFSIFLSLPFPTIYRRFVVRTHVGDAIIDLSGLVIVLATLDALCWIMSVMVSMMVSMSSSSCVSIRFLNSSWNYIFFFHICVVPTRGVLLVISFFLSTSTSRLMSFNVILWSLPMLTWLMTFTSMVV